MQTNKNPLKVQQDTSFYLISTSLRWDLIEQGKKKSVIKEKKRLAAPGALRLGSLFHSLFIYRALEREEVLIQDGGFWKRG